MNGVSHNGSLRNEDVVQNGVGGSTEAWEAFYTEQLKNPTLIVKRTSYNASGKKAIIVAHTLVSVSPMTL
jgi:hypothetical protein